MVPRVAAMLAALCLLPALSACGVGTPDPAPDVEPTDRVPASPAVLPVVVSGRVLGVRSAPVSGALVTLRADPGLAGCGRCGRLLADRTDADGRFVLLVPAGTYLLACTVGVRRSCGSRAIDVEAPTSLRLLVPPVGR